MGLISGIRSLFASQDARGSGPLEPARILDVPSGSNFRDLGGYDTPEGPTAWRRFVRAGSTAYLTDADLTRLEAYGVTHVIDLRSSFEAPRSSDRFSRRDGVTWLNVPLFDYDLSDPALVGEAPAGNYLIDGYVTMVSNRSAIRRIFEFCGEAAEVGGGVLFHCAAGMDRTGMTAMLLLGLAEVPREQVVADYLYSFAPVERVDEAVFAGRMPEVEPGSWNPLPTRREAIEFMYDRIAAGYGTVHAYLSSCGISDECLDAVRGMLVRFADERDETDGGSSR